MRATTTTRNGPVARRRSCSSRHPSGRRDSRNKWTKRRGPVTSFIDTWLASRTDTDTDTDAGTPSDSPSPADTSGDD